MSTDATPPPRKRRFRKTKILLAVLLLLGFCFAAYRLTLVAMIHAKLDAIRKAGEPATLAELVATLPPPPPAGENAADVYQLAFGRFVKPDETNTNLPFYGYPKLPPRSQPLPPEMKRAIADYVARNAETLSLVRKAASMKQCRIPLDWEAAPRMDFRHLSQIKTLGYLLRIEAILCTDEGKTKEATEDIFALIGVANALRDEPLMITQLFRWTLLETGFSTLERLLNQLTFSNEDLVRLSGVMGTTERSLDFQRMLIAELCYMSSNLQQVTVEGFVGAVVTVSDSFSKLKAELSSMGLEFENDLGRPSSEEWSFLRVVFYLYKITGAQDADQLALLELMGDAISARRTHFPDWLATLDTIRVRASQKPFYLLATRECLPNGLYGISNRVRSVVAKMRITRAVLALEHFRNDNGRLPDQLAELEPKHLDAIPADPYDGKPLRYRKLSPPHRGYVVYSVGEDGRDDGGFSRSKSGPSFEPDITFTVER